MAGSKRWFTYVADNGTNYALNLDESNTESVNPAGSLGVPAVATVHSRPSNLRPRFAVYSNNLQTEFLKVTLLTVAAYNALEADHPTISSPSNQSTLSLEYKRPEQLKPAVKRRDTGLLDGDQEGASAPVP